MAICSPNSPGFRTIDSKLCAIQAEWVRGDQSYTQRVNHLRGTTTGGLNGTVFLKATGPGQTVFDDPALNPQAVDQLIGGNGQDWFFANRVPTSGEESDTIVGGLQPN